MLKQSISYILKDLMLLGTVFLLILFSNWTICIFYLKCCVKKFFSTKQPSGTHEIPDHLGSKGSKLWQNSRGCYSQSQWAAKLRKWELPTELSAFTLEENCFFTLDEDAIILFLSQPHAYTPGDNSGLYRMLFMSLWGKKNVKKKSL